MHLDPQNRRTALALLIAIPAAIGALGGCKTLAGRPDRFVPDEVVVVGTLGEGHRGNPGYDLEVLERLLRELDPHRILCEIPPDRFEASWSEFVYTAEVEDERVREFPEITEVVFPLALEGRIRLEPCSAWKAEVAERRAALLGQWRTSRPADTRDVEAARSRARERIAEAGLERTPLRVNGEPYDRIVAEGMATYQRVFDRDLALGGWEEENRAHYALIAAALDASAGEGLRIVILFRSWHRYRLLELLAGRTDIELLTLEEALEREALRP